MAQGGGHVPNPVLKDEGGRRKDKGRRKPKAGSPLDLFRNGGKEDRETSVAGSCLQRGALVEPRRERAPLRGAAKLSALARQHTAQGRGSSFILHALNACPVWVHG